MANDGGDVSGKELYSMLPNSTSAFEAYYNEITDYTEFYTKVYEVRNEKPLAPYRYGSYQIY